MELLKYHMYSNPDFALGHAVVIAGLIVGQYTTYKEYADACATEGVVNAKEEYFDLFKADIVPMFN
jgi:hypothetical protein